MLQGRRHAQQFAGFAIAPALSINVASVAISTTGKLLGVSRGVGDAGAGDDPAVRRRASMFSRVVASRYFAR